MVIINLEHSRFASKGKSPHSTKQVLDLEKINEKVEKKLEKDRKKAVRISLRHSIGIFVLLTRFPS